MDLQTLAIGVGTTIFAGVALLLMGNGNRGPKKPGRAFNYGSHGSGRWATTKELLKAFSPTGAGVILGRVLDGKRLRTVIHSFADQTKNQFCVIIGPPGSGKTSRFSLPNLAHAAQEDRQRTIIATDPKGELYRETADAYRKAGFQVYVLNLINPAASDRFNPLDYVRTVQDAIRLANTIIVNTDEGGGGGEAFWKNSERSLLAATIWLTKSRLDPKYQNLGNVLHLLGAFYGDQELADEVMGMIPDGDGARTLYETVAGAQDKTRDGIYIGAQVRLQLWATDEVRTLTATSDFNLRDLGTTPSILYLIIPDHHGTYRSFTSLFFDQAFQELIEYAEANGGRLPVPVRFLLEELANVGRIPDLDKRLGTIRSRGIGVEMILQTLGQLKGLYGDLSSVILGCADTTLVLSANDLETARYVSELLGVSTIKTSSTSSSHTDKGGSEGLSFAYTGRPLMLPDEVMGKGAEGLLFDDLLLVQRGLPPARLQKYPVDDYPGYADRTKVQAAQYVPPERDPFELIDPLSLLSDEALARYKVALAADKQALRLRAERVFKLLACLPDNMVASFGKTVADAIARVKAARASEAPPDDEKPPETTTPGWVIRKDGIS